MLVGGLALAVGIAIYDLTVRELDLSGTATQSQYAIYAADTGAECALYWDVKNPSGSSAFDPSTSSTINCNQDANNGGNQWVVGGSSASTFTMTFLPDPSCAIVTVTKLTGNATRIESLGYNTCNSESSRRVERAIRATY